MPDDFYADLGLATLISPLRLRGMSAMLTRIKRPPAGGRPVNTVVSYGGTDNPDPGLERP